jgi:hypothetical protein
MSPPWHWNFPARVDRIQLSSLAVELYEFGIVSCGVYPSRENVNSAIVDVDGVSPALQDLAFRNQLPLQALRFPLFQR